jgi:hypothetical protein
MLAAMCRGRAARLGMLLWPTDAVPGLLPVARGACNKLRTDAATSHLKLLISPAPPCHLCVCICCCVCRGEEGQSAFEYLMAHGARYNQTEAPGDSHK